MPAQFLFCGVNDHGDLFKGHILISVVVWYLLLCISFANFLSRLSASTLGLVHHLTPSDTDQAWGLGSENTQGDSGVTVNGTVGRMRVGD